MLATFIADFKIFQVGIFYNYFILFKI